VPTPEADVDVPSPPNQAGVTTPPPDEVEGRRQEPLVARRPRWGQIGVAVLLAGTITTIPQLIWALIWALVNRYWPPGAGGSPPGLLVYGILHPLTLFCGLWAGLAWPGRHPKGHVVLGSFAALLDLAINWSLGRVFDFWSYITVADYVSTIGIAALFTAGGLFGDLIESWRLPRRREEESEVVRGIAQKASGPGRQPSETTLKLVQALGPSIIALIGLMIAVITQSTNSYP
jgi:hypothetical protein